MTSARRTEVKDAARETRSPMVVMVAVVVVVARETNKLAMKSGEIDESATIKTIAERSSACARSTTRRTM